MDLETDPVAGPVDEPARHRIVDVVLLARAQGVVAGREDDVLDELVHLDPRDTGTEGLDPGVLRLPHDLVHLHDLGPGRAL